MNDNDIGGGVVRRTFTTNRDGKTVRVVQGTQLSREEMLAMPRSNLKALVENRYISVWPMAADGELIVVNRGFGKFDVVIGRRLNAEPIDGKDAAEQFAAEAKAAAVAKSGRGAKRAVAA